MIFMQSRYGVCFGSSVQIGFDSYALSGCVTYPIEAFCHGSYCSFSIMKRRYSLAALGNFVYLKIIWLKNKCNSVARPTGPIGKLACPMSAAIALIFGSCDVFAA